MQGPATWEGQPKVPLADSEDAAAEKRQLSVRATNPLS